MPGSVLIIARHITADFDNALVVSDLLIGRQVKDNRLELRADLVAEEALRVVDVQLDRGRVIGRTARRVKAVALQLVQESLVRRRVMQCRSYRLRAGSSRLPSARPQTSR